MVCRVAPAGGVSGRGIGSSNVSGLGRPTCERHSGPALPIARRHDDIRRLRDFLGAIFQERPCIKARGA